MWGDKMELRKIIILKYFAIIGLLGLTVIIKYLPIVNELVNEYIVIATRLIILGTVLTLIYRWFVYPYSKLASYIDELAVIIDRDVKDSKDKSESLLPLIARKIFRTYKEKENQRIELLEQLKIQNSLLVRNNKITTAIMEITSEILNSGEIDRVLQMILDKAVEIIPNAHKGSIIIMEDERFRYKALCGYNFEILNKMTFKLEDMFQYKSGEYFEPIVIYDLEDFNRKNLEGEKFDILEKGKGFEQESLLSCGIEINGEFVGAISLDNVVDKFAFKEEDKILIKHLANQIGIALKNARLVEKITYLSKYDSLTGVYNRHAFEEILEKIYEKAVKLVDEFALIIFDMNDVKKVNDSYGHDYGDLLIKTFADTIMGSIGEKDIFARIGGDEFAAILMGKNNIEAAKVIEDIKETFTENPLIIESNHINITFGHGIVDILGDLNSIRELLKAADMKMYKEKRRMKENISVVKLE